MHTSSAAEHVERAQRFLKFRVFRGRQNTTIQLFDMVSRKIDTNLMFEHVEILKKYNQLKTENNWFR